MSEEWAWERDNGFDPEGFQQKQACFGIAVCPRCGKDVELIAETECWVEAEDGRNIHDGWGPAMGVCCGVLLVDSWDGFSAYDLESHHHGGIECPGCPECDWQDEGQGGCDDEWEYFESEEDW